jgi:hypothetical protein
MFIDIQFVNFPKPGGSGKYGNLKLRDGRTIMCPADLLHHFRAGMQCEIGFKQQTWGQGTDRAQLVTIATSGPQQQGMQGGQQGGYQGHGQQAGYQQGQARSAYQRPSQGFRVIQGGSGGPVGAGRSEPDPRMIFVTGVVGRAMGSGKFAASEIGVLTQEAAASYDRLQNPRPAPAPGALDYNANQASPANQPVDEPPPEYEQGDPGPGAA